MHSLTNRHLHETGLDSGEAQQLVVVIMGRNLAQAFRVVACVESEQLLTTVWK